MVCNVVDNYVVAICTLGEILFGVINHVICAERSDKINISSTAYASNFSAERFGDLHRESPDTAGRAIDQNLLPRLNLSFVAHTLQRRNPRDVDGSCLFKTDAGRLQCDCSHGPPADILGKGPTSTAEHVIAWFELSDILTDRF